jgi:Tfp pilus assembly protein PilV
MNTIFSKHKSNQSAGFTLVETMIAVFLLTLTVGGLLTLAANGYFSVRYAKNEIIANNLMQEGLEYIRNDRDSNFLQGHTWEQWVEEYSDTGGATQHGCFSATGCMVDPYTSNASTHVVPCSSGTCLPLSYFPDSGFYGYPNTIYPGTVAQDAADAYATTYTRTVTMQQSTADGNQITVTVTVTWLNGNAKESKSQSILITNWHTLQ